MEEGHRLNKKVLRFKHTVPLLKNLILASQGKIKSSLIIKNANLVDVIVGDIREAVNIAVWDEYVVRVGYFDIDRYRGDSTVILDARDAEVVTPGFVEPHVHVESSLLTVQEFGKAVLMHGTTTVAADPHEIGNVLGVEGVRMFIEESRYTPLRIFFYAPSCVPPTKSGFDTPGQTIGPDEVRELLSMDEVIGLGEVMDFASVVEGDEGVLSKIVAAKELGKLVDGHAPQLPEELIVPYATAGIEGDHESVYMSEALTKLRNGMHILMREGSAWRDVEELSKMLTYMRVNTRYLMFAADDMEVLDLVEEGHLDRVLRKAVSLGVDPITAVQMATLNPAQYLGLKEVGAVVPGRFADIVVLESFRRFKVRDVVVGGEIVVKDGRYVAADRGKYKYPRKAYETMNVGKEVVPEDFSIKAPIKEGRVNYLAIKAIPGKALTKKEVVEVEVVEGEIVLPERGDLAYVATVERHHATGNVGKGLVTGLGLVKGAVAQTIAHDVHNVIVVGRSKREMTRAVNELVRMGGGMVAVLNDSVIASVKLPIAGLMSDRGLNEVYSELKGYVNGMLALGFIVRCILLTFLFRF
ncbi:MAG: adenine deaminase, partial [Desulfurococcales archaeon]|nr:adenine deaminase [Desulfurococcales archaeon]